MTLNVFYKPASPFDGPIQGGLRPGMQILVSGTSEGPDGFAFNLACGEGEYDDKALHFNPRFRELEVVRNTMTGGGWGWEERRGSFPFTQNTYFDVVFFVTPDNIRVSVNGQHFCDYNHRIPLERVTCITSRGGSLTLDLIRIDLPIPYAGEGHLAMCNPVSPFMGPVRGWMRKGQLIMVSGIPEESDGFAINLACGRGEYDDKALHFNPRFHENEVVRNTMTGGGWGQEERHGPFPFKQNDRFDVVFVVMPDNFRVFVNGHYFCAYNHRLPVERVTCIYASRGVRVDLTRIV